MKYPLFGIATLVAAFTFSASSSEGASKQAKPKPHLTPKKKAVQKPKAKPTTPPKPKPTSTPQPKTTSVPIATAQPKSTSTPEPTPPLPIIVQPGGVGGPKSTGPKMGFFPRRNPIVAPRRTPAVPPNPSALSIGAKATP